jgi:hypothetical protein
VTGKAGGTRTEPTITKFVTLNDDDPATAEWYLTVRCTNPGCGLLIAFQKSSFAGNSDFHGKIAGAPTVDCPHCKTLVRVRADQINRRQVVLTQ